MAAANPQPHITLNPFRGKADEKLAGFRKSCQKSRQCWHYPKRQPTPVSSTSLTRSNPAVLQDFATSHQR